MPTWLRNAAVTALIATASAGVRMGISLAQLEQRASEVERRLDRIDQVLERRLMAQENDDGSE